MSIYVCLTIFICISTFWAFIFSIVLEEFGIWNLSKKVRSGQTDFMLVSSLLLLIVIFSSCFFAISSLKTPQMKFATRRTSSYSPGWNLAVYESS